MNPRIPVDAETFARATHEIIRTAGLSDEGRRWLLQALDPAHDHGSDGFPDCSARPCFRPITTAQRVITPDASLQRWDAAFFVPDGDGVAAYYAVGPAGTDFSMTNEPGPPADCIQGFLPLFELVQGASGLDCITLVRNSPGGDSPWITNIVTGLDSPLKLSAIRTVFRGLTITLNASDLANQGQVYAAQVSGATSRAGNYMAYTETPGDQALASYAVEMFRIPTDEDTIMSTVPKSYSGPAKDGVYIPMRFGGPQNEFGSASGIAGSIAPLPAINPLGAPGGGWTQSDAAVLFPTGASNNQISSGSYPYVPTTSAPGVKPVWWLDPNRPNMSPNTFAPAVSTRFGAGNASIVIFRGLAGVGSGFGASLTVRSRVGFEVAPTASGTDRVFTKDPAPFDPRALELYYRVSLALPSVYPSTANGFADVLSGIWDAVKSTLAPIITPFLHAAGDVARQIPAALANQAVDALTARAAGAFGGQRDQGERRPSRPAAPRAPLLIEAPPRPGKKPRARAPQRDLEAALARSNARLAGAGGAREMRNPEPVSNARFRSLAIEGERAR